MYRQTRLGQLYITAGRWQGMQCVSVRGLLYLAYGTTLLFNFAKVQIQKETQLQIQIQIKKLIRTSQCWPRARLCNVLQSEIESVAPVVSANHL